MREHWTPVSGTMVLQKEKEETEHSVLSRMERRRGSRRYLGPRCPESCPQAGCWFNWCVPLNQPRIIAIWLVAFCNPACELFRWKNVVRRRLQTSWTPTCGEEERAAGWLTTLSPNKAAMLMFVPGGPDEEGGSPRSRIGFKDSKRQLTLGGLYAEKMQRLKATRRRGIQWCKKMKISWSSADCLTSRCNGVWIKTQCSEGFWIWTCFLWSLPVLLIEPLQTRNSASLRPLSCCVPTRSWYYCWKDHSEWTSRHPTI